MNFNIKHILNIELLNVNDLSIVYDLIKNVNIVVEHFDDYELECEYSSVLLNDLLNYKIIDINSYNKMINTVKKHKNITHMTISINRVDQL